MNMLPMIVFICCLLCCLQATSAISINSSIQLEGILCENATQDVEIVLNSSVDFQISGQDFCQVSNSNFMSITSDSIDKYALITCTNNDTTNQKRRGFLFFNSSIILQRLVLNKCGSFLNTISKNHILDRFNNSLYYTEYHAASLVFIHCQVYAINISIRNSVGFAVIGNNMYNSSFNNITISDTLKQYEINETYFGSGLMIHFTEDSSMTMNSAFVNISNSLFHNNFVKNSNRSKACLPEKYKKIKWNPVLNAGSLTILYTQFSYSANVIIDNTSFIDNIGDIAIAGGVLVFQYSTPIQTLTVINNSLFQGNHVDIKSVCHGSAFTYYWIEHEENRSLSELNPLIVHNTVIKSNNGKTISTGAFFIGVYDEESGRILKLSFSNCTCDSNLVFISGSCLFAAILNRHGNTKLRIELNDIIAQNNSQDLVDYKFSIGGIFSFYYADKVFISGTSVFENNFGSVIDAVNSNIFITGNVTFANNKGSNGAAIRLHGSCHLTFEGEDSRVEFNNNKAQLEGGAIYINSGFYGRLLLIKQCQILIKESQLYFTNNTAVNSGNSIYSSSLCNCENKGEIVNKTHYDSHFIFNDKSSNSLQQISTQPIKLELCNRTNDDTFTVFPGQTITLSLKAIDDCNRTVYSTVSVYIIADNYNKSNENMWIDKTEYKIIEKVGECTQLPIKVHYNTTQPWSIIKSRLVFNLPEYPDILSISLSILKCPLGFELNNRTGMCECSKVLYMLDFLPSACNINELTIFRNSQSTRILWIGKINNSIFAVSRLCPLDYCFKYPKNFSIINNTVYVNKNQSLCFSNRDGLLCGRCSNSTSNVFGTTDCRVCSSWWAFTLILYGIAGLLLVFLLYILRLTLTTGTLNGIIFFSQALYCGAFDLMKLHHEENMPIITQICQILLSLLSLNLGFPICFLNEMSMLLKTGLTLIFPLYLLTIVAALIILSRYSLRLSNVISNSSVQVLVTILHLSFSKLLLTIIDVFTPVHIYSANRNITVWFYDGNEEFGQGPHLALMVVTLVVVVPLILPYIFILIFHKFFLHTRLNEYIRPFTEAIHGPYKEGKEYWFVSRLLLLTFMYVVYTCYRGINHFMIVIIIVPIYITFIIIQSISWPFKKDAINIIDGFYNWYVSLFFIFSWYFFSDNHKPMLSMMATVLAYIGLFSICCVLVYHFLVVFGKDKIIKDAFMKARNKCKWNAVISLRKREVHLYPLTDTSGTQDDPFYTSCNYREPLLESM
jgi:transcription initiation factor TFIID subunit 2/histone acetyltransferase MYST3